MRTLFVVGLLILSIAIPLTAAVVIALVARVTLRRIGQDEIEPKGDSPV